MKTSLLGMFHRLGLPCLRYFNALYLLLIIWLENRCNGIIRGRIEEFLENKEAELLWRRFEGFSNLGFGVERESKHQSLLILIFVIYIDEVTSFSADMDLLLESVNQQIKWALKFSSNFSFHSKHTIRKRVQFKFKLNRRFDFKQKLIISKWNHSRICALLKWI